MSEEKKKLNNLKNINKEKSEMSYKKSINAVIELQKQNKKVNFNSVSKVANVSTNYLYKNEELRKLIENIRNEEIEDKLNIECVKDKIYKVKYDKLKKELEEKNKEIKILNEKNVELMFELNEIKRQ